MLPSSRGGENLAVEVRERVGERIAPLMRTRGCRRVDVDVVRDEVLLQHLARGDQEVAVAPLASELDGLDRQVRELASSQQ